jgi:hypothetical protein
MRNHRRPARGRSSSKADLQMPGLKLLESGLLKAEAQLGADMREASMTALCAVVDFIDTVRGWEHLNLSKPLWMLAAALKDLEDGRAVEMLRPNPAVRNRKPDGTMRNMAKAYALYGVDILRDAGETTGEACRVVARQFEGAGICIGKRPTTPSWKVVKGWRDRLSKLGKANHCSQIIEALGRDAAPENRLSRSQARIYVAGKLKQLLSMQAQELTHGVPPSKPQMI